MRRTSESAAVAAAANNACMASAGAWLGAVCDGNEDADEEEEEEEEEEEADRAEGNEDAPAAEGRMAAVAQMAGGRHTLSHRGKVRATSAWKGERRPTQTLAMSTLLLVPLSDALDDDEDDDDDGEVWSGSVSKKNETIASMSGTAHRNTGKMNNHTNKPGVSFRVQYQNSKRESKLLSMRIERVMQNSVPVSCLNWWSDGSTTAAAAALRPSGAFEAPPLISETGVGWDGTNRRNT
jgi:hypothetical protein